MVAGSRYRRTAILCYSDYGPTGHGHLVNTLNHIVLSNIYSGMVGQSSRSNFYSWLSNLSYGLRDAKTHGEEAKLIKFNVEWQRSNKKSRQLKCKRLTKCTHMYIPVTIRHLWRFPGGTINQLTLPGTGVLSQR